MPVLRINHGWDGQPAPAVDAAASGDRAAYVTAVYEAGIIDGVARAVALGFGACPGIGPGTEPVAGRHAVTGCSPR